MAPQGENPTLGRDEVHSQLGEKRKGCDGSLGVKEINGPLRTMPRVRVCRPGYQPLRNHGGNRRKFCL